MVLISPILSFKGLNIPIKSHKFFNSKMMYITGKNDRVILNFYLNTPPIVKQYPLGGSGTQLIKANKEAVFDIVNFIIEDAKKSQKMTCKSENLRIAAHFLQFLRQLGYKH